MTRWRCHCRSGPAGRRGGQQVLVLRRQIGDDLVDARPEGVGVDLGTGQRLVVDEVVQRLGDAQVTHRHTIGHIVPPSAAWRRLRTAVGPVYPRVAGPIASGGHDSHQQFIASIGDRGPQRRGSCGDVLLCPDTARPAGLDLDRLESVVAEIIGARPHVEFAGVGGQPGSRTTARTRPTDPVCSTICSNPWRRARSPVVPNRLIASRRGARVQCRGGFGEEPERVEMGAAQRH